MGISSLNLEIYSNGLVNHCMHLDDGVILTTLPCAIHASLNSEPSLFTQMIDETSPSRPRMALTTLFVDRSYTRSEPSSMEYQLTISRFHQHFHRDAFGRETHLNLRTIGPHARAQGWRRALGSRRCPGSRTSWPWSSSHREPEDDGGDQGARRGRRAREFSVLVHVEDGVSRTGRLCAGLAPSSSGWPGDSGRLWTLRSHWQVRGHLLYPILLSPTADDFLCKDPHLELDRRPLAKCLNSTRDACYR